MNLSRKKKIAILAPYPYGQAPSQRFRFEQYIEFLTEQNREVFFFPFLDERGWKTLYKEGSVIHKVLSMLRSFTRRFLLLFTLWKYDFIFIHREASMIGPPVFEWIISKILRKKYIYDFDDAIWLPNYSESNARFHRLKAYGKVKKIIKWAGTVSVGNEYLKEYTLQFNQNVIIIPTTIDTEKMHNLTVNQDTEPIIIGWTGTHTTMHYLDYIVPVLKTLEKKYKFKFRVISNQAPELEIKSLEYVPWNKSTEIADLASLHIGVMPLTDSIWAKGKCGFKGLQYMSLEIPAIMSPVGVNNSIVKHGINGYLCSTAKEWEAALVELIENPDRRKEIGRKGKETVLESYSVLANRNKYLGLFQE